MLPPAPALFSITNCCPSSSAILAPMTRATVSVGPPAENDTTIRTGLDGYWSSALAPVQASAAATAASCNNLRRGSVIASRGNHGGRKKTPAHFFECKPADGMSAATEKKWDFGTSRWAARQSGYINGRRDERGERARRMTA